MEKKRMTQKYWNSLEEGSRFRCLKAILYNFSDDTIHSYAKEKAKDMGFVWEIVVSKVRQTSNSCYKTCVNNTYIP